MTRKAKEEEKPAEIETTGEAVDAGAEPTNEPATAGAPTERPPPPIKVEPYMTHLRVVLTAAQIAERADRAAHLLADRDAKESEQKASAKHAKSVIDQIEADLRVVSSEVRQKATYEDVRCERRFIYETSKVEEVRLDTGETMHVRDMNEAEKQVGLPFDDDKKPEPGNDLDDDFGGDEAAQ